MVLAFHTFFLLKFIVNAFCQSMESQRYVSKNLKGAKEVLKNLEWPKKSSPASFKVNLA